jgi:hypothetical protein
VKVEIRVSNDRGEIIVMKHQPPKRPGEDQPTQLAVLEDTVIDARNWLRRNS